MFPYSFHIMKRKLYQGVTLLEITIVVFILALFAVLALPSFTSADKYQIDLAKSEIVEAIRFARSKAMHTGDVYGVNVGRSVNNFTVFKANIEQNPVGLEFIALHPINKELYSYNINSDFNLSHISISNAVEPFLYTDGVRRKTLLFSAAGIPVWIDVGAGVTYQLSSGTVEITKGTRTEVVSVQPYSGRVTVQ